MNHEQIRSYIDEAMGEALDLEVMQTLNEAIKEIEAEVRNLYTSDLLVRSDSWHAFKSSGRPNNEPLPASVEEGVNKVINDLIERKLKPVLR